MQTIIYILYVKFMLLSLFSFVGHAFKWYMLLWTKTKDCGIAFKSFSFVGRAFKWYMLLSDGIHFHFARLWHCFLSYVSVNWLARV